MQKSSKIIIAITILIVLGLIIGLIAGVVSLINKEKESITASQFKTIMEQKNYMITDASSQFSQYSYVDQVYIAGDNNYGYQIEFYELSDESNAISFYNNNASNFQARKGNSSTETNVNGKNFSKYTLSSGGNYMVVSRIDNTVIYIDVDSNYKDEVKNILDEIGY